MAISLLPTEFSKLGDIILSTVDKYPEVFSSEVEGCDSIDNVLIVL